MRERGESRRQQGIWPKKLEEWISLRGIIFKKKYQKLGLIIVKYGCLLDIQVEVSNS